MTIEQRVFDSDVDEARGIATELARMPLALSGKTAVLGRTRAILQPILHELKALLVPVWIATRRDRFSLPQFVWLQASLDQALRPPDRQVFIAMVGAADCIARTELDPILLAAQAGAAGLSLLEHWAVTIGADENPDSRRLSQLALRLV